MTKDHIPIISKIGLIIEISGLLGLFVFTTSCATTSSTVKGNFSDRIMAENSQMKKRLVLIEREYDVLDQENQQYKKQVHELTAKNDKLRSDLNESTDQYEKDMNIILTQNQNLHKEYMALLLNSTQDRKRLIQRYDELDMKQKQDIKAFEEQIASHKTKYEKEIARYEERYQELEAKHTEHINTLDTHINRQKATFDKERDELEQQYAAKEDKLLNQIKELNKLLDNHKAQITSLQKENKEISLKYDNILNEFEKVKLQRDRIHKDLQSEKQTNISLIEKHKNALKKINSKEQTN